MGIYQTSQFQIIRGGSEMLKLFGETDKPGVNNLYSTNGDLVIKPKKAVVTKEDNGEFYLELETAESYAAYLTEGRIIVANTPQGEQAFRVNNVSLRKRKVKVKAYHVFYDSEDYLIKESNVTFKSCNDALDQLNMATDTQSPFTVISDVNTINSYKCVRKSLYGAIKDVLEGWGGHLVRDNFHIAIRANIGADNGVTIRYAKNLQEIEKRENWDYIVTKLLPTGKDGIMLNDLDQSIDPYVYSQQITYALPYTKTVKFNQDNITQEQFKNATTKQVDKTAYKQALISDLRKQAVKYIEKNCIPRINYTLKATVDKLTDIGDTIEVIDEDLEINILTTVIKYKYDCILEKYTEIEFGNFKENLQNLLPSFRKASEEIAITATEVTRVSLTAELEEATDRIWSVLGSSYVIYEGNRILVVDKLPKEDATNVMMINSAGIGFSNTGIYGTFTSAWTIDGTLNMQAINAINITADMIKGGTLKLGSRNNESGVFELYDESNTLIGEMNKFGFKMYGADGSYILINNEVGFAGYDRLGNKIFWADRDEFHMKKGVIEEELSLFQKMNFLPVTYSEGNITYDGIAIVGYPS